MLKKKIILGKFGKVYGIKGWIRLFSYTQNKVDIFFYKNLFILDNKKKIFFLKFNKYIFKKKSYIVQINHFYKNEDIISFVNYKIYIFKSNLIKYRNKNEYYWNDIIGCRVINIKKIYLGIVSHIMETKIHDIIIIKSNSRDMNKKNILIPFIENKIIKKIDLINNYIITDWYL
ncbi:ribosome maturation factor RimM [Enterobacteriaceae endosymbiont of Donacia semicuprea]|uniref:ribosome maturation factor RimM n=1 Tax=Enterobacteriaceae endosymbiont of Donacia semicuprea TaxID=2675783 RepID=UPI00144A2395|nr:ribosome maturation factor RimM [Enterobacteriaceae endosymbiont of Donacia semicuprea]QJC33045.1 16S rRNA processing protein RimM [Enterobacteriaceae endosymbiont of Donacia semicuprea]